MKNLNRYKSQPAVFKHLLVGLLAVAALTVTGCGGERDANDGQNITQVALPTDVVLNLFCADVGIGAENCVLDDPENPFIGTPIPEFDPNADPNALTKFEIADSIPVGPSGAKARFYFWATALARRQSGENQYFTALALHELYTANSNALSVDTLIQEHALRAYRSVLDNFFGSVLVFTCFECAPIPGSDPNDPEFPNFTVVLNERVADHLYRTLSTATPTYPNGLRRLIPGDPVLVLDRFVDWGYSYQPCTDLPECTNGVVTVAEF